MGLLKDRKKFLSVLGLCFVALVCVWLWRTVGAEMVRFISDPAAFRDWVNQYGAYSRLGFIGMVIFQIIIAIIPGEPFEIAAGYAFGVWEGTALCMLSASLGSMLTFGLVRQFGMRLVRIFFSEEQIASVHFLKFSQKRDLLFLIIYTIPGTPKDLLGYFAGLTDIRFPVWMLICTFGRFPSIITSILGGDALGTENYGMAAVVFVFTLAISAAGLLVYNRLCAHKKEEACVK